MVLSFRRGSEAERAFWTRPWNAARSATAISRTPSASCKHRALDDTIERAHHYGAMAKDALALFPASPMKDALNQAVDFCVARTH